MKNEPKLIRRMKPEICETYDALVAWKRDKKRTPSLRQLAEVRGVATSTVHYHMQRLEAAGNVVKIEGESRSWTPVSKPVRKRSA